MSTVPLGRAFELEVAAVFAGYGYRVRHRGGSGDDGVDLEIVYPEQVRYGIVQCKAHQGTLPPTHIRALYGAMLHEGADEGWLVTTGRVGPNARAWATGKPIRVVDARTLAQWRSGALLDEGRRLLRLEAQMHSFSLGGALVLGLGLGGAAFAGLGLLLKLGAIAAAPGAVVALVPVAGALLLRRHLQQEYESLAEQIRLQRPHRGLAWTLG